MSRCIKYIATFCFCLISVFLFSQDIEDLLYQEVTPVNPVYKPVIGFGIGNFNYLGDIRNPQQTPLTGSFGYFANMSTFIDNKHYIRANIFFFGGKLTGNERSITDLNRNFNFQSDILAFGVNLNYDFDNFYKKYSGFHPFISIGVESIIFSSKIDSIDAIGRRYNYWSDGTIRDVPETPFNQLDGNSLIIQRDFKYEKDIKEIDWGAPDYPPYIFAVPVEAGFDFWLSNRLMFRAATSFHFLISDYIDHVHPDNTSGIKGDKMPDFFMFTTLSFHFDMFSDPKTLTIERMFADVEFDPTMYGDEDNDGWFDGWDECPGTPYGAETDSTGCPVDSDLDGVPDYRDNELYSGYGAYVDDRGVEISEDKLIALLDNSKAVRREDVALYLRTSGSSRYGSRKAGQIPPKFTRIDRDNDGYVSFDEMLDEIDKFFDFDSGLSSDDIYELNKFFFSQ